MSDEEFPPAIIEQIFKNNTARVIDHFMIHLGFDYTIEELGKILHIPEIELLDIILTLKEFELVQIMSKTGVRTYRLFDNDRTHLLRKFQFQVATHEIDKSLEK